MMQASEADHASHYFFLPAVWRATLRCMNPTEAVHVSSVYGCQQLPWVMRNLVEETPDTYSWGDAAEAGDIAMMRYLMRYNIPCPNIRKLLQQAVDQGRDRVAVFFLTPEHTFLNEQGNRIRLGVLPFLDRACRRNHISVVRGVLALSDSMGRNPTDLLTRPTKTLDSTMKRGWLQMVGIMVPRMCQMTQDSFCRVAVQGNLAMCAFAISHLNEPFDTKLVQAVGQSGNLDIVQLIPLTTANDAQTLLDTAMVHGSGSIVRHVLSTHPNLLPSNEAILDACGRGSFSTVSMLPNSVMIPQMCMRASLKSNSTLLIFELHRRFAIIYPRFKYSVNLLRAAIKSGKSDNVVVLFECGGYKSLPTELHVDLVEHNCREALQVFFQLGFPVYSQVTLLAAARNGRIEILGDIVQHFKPDPQETQEAKYTISLHCKDKDQKILAFKLVSTTEDFANPEVKRTKTAE